MSLIKLRFFAESEDAFKTQYVRFVWLQKSARCLYDKQLRKILIYYCFRKYAIKVELETLLTSASPSWAATIRGVDP